MTHIEFIVAAITHVKAKNIAEKKLDKHGVPYRGLHVVFSKLNDALRAMYATPTMTADERKELPKKLIADAVAAGLVVSIPTKMGPTLYLTADAPASNRGPAVTSKEDAMKLFGMTPPPVIAPPATAAKRTTGRK